MNTVTKCLVKECTRTDIKGHGYCALHYCRLRANGHTERTRLDPEIRKKYAAEYKVYRGIRTRCLNKNAPSYKHYGGRGIKVCDRWLEKWGNGFLNFIEDMGKRPEGTSIDRINVDGDYEPSNCRWATPKEQANNKRSNHFIEFNGERGTVSEWADKIGVKRHTLEERLRRGEQLETALTRPAKKISRDLGDLARAHGIPYMLAYKRLRRGWSLEEAVNTPLQHSGFWRPEDTIQIGGVHKTIKEWAIEYSMPYDTVGARIRRGWDPERALTEVVHKKNRIYKKKK